MGERNLPAFPSTWRRNGQIALLAIHSTKSDLEPHIIPKVAIIEAPPYFRRKRRDIRS